MTDLRPFQTMDARLTPYEEIREGGITIKRYPASEYCEVQHVRARKKHHPRLHHIGMELC